MMRTSSAAQFLETLKIKLQGDDLDAIWSIYNEIQAHLYRKENMDDFTALLRTEWLSLLPQVVLKIGFQFSENILGKLDPFELAYWNIAPALSQSEQIQLFQGAAKTYGALSNSSTLLSKLTEQCGEPLFLVKKNLLSRALIYASQAENLSSNLLAEEKKTPHLMLAVPVDAGHAPNEWQRDRDQWASEFLLLNLIPLLGNCARGEWRILEEIPHLAVLKRLCAQLKAHFSLLASAKEMVRSLYIKEMVRLLKQESLVVLVENKQHWMAALEVIVDQFLIDRNSDREMMLPLCDVVIELHNLRPCERVETVRDDPEYAAQNRIAQTIDLILRYKMDQGVSDDRLFPPLPFKEWQQTLHRLRELFPPMMDLSNDLSLGKWGPVQNMFSEGVLRLLREIVHNVILWLGTPPIPFAIMAYGSLSRCDMGPFSDVDLFLLAQGDSDTPLQDVYFSNLIDFLKETLLLLPNPWQVPLRHGDKWVSVGLDIDAGMEREHRIAHTVRSLRFRMREMLVTAPNYLSDAWEKQYPDYYKITAALFLVELYHAQGAERVFSDYKLMLAKLFSEERRHEIGRKLAAKSLKEWEESLKKGEYDLKEGLPTDYKKLYLQPLTLALCLRHWVENGHMASSNPYTIFRQLADKNNVDKDWIFTAIKQLVFLQRYRSWGQLQRLGRPDKFCRPGAVTPRNAVSFSAEMYKRVQHMNKCLIVPLLSHLGPWLSLEGLGSSYHPVFEASNALLAKSTSPMSPYWSAVQEAVIDYTLREKIDFPERLINLKQHYLRIPIRWERDYKDQLDELLRMNPYGLSAEEERQIKQAIVELHEVKLMRVESIIPVFFGAATPESAATHAAVAVHSPSGVALVVAEPSDIIEFHLQVALKAIREDDIKTLEQVLDLSMPVQELEFLIKRVAIELGAIKFIIELFTWYRDFLKRSNIIADGARAGTLIKEIKTVRNSKMDGLESYLTDQGENQEQIEAWKNKINAKINKIFDILIGNPEGFTKSLVDKANLKNNEYIADIDSRAQELDRIASIYKKELVKLQAHASNERCMEFLETHASQLPAIQRVAWEGSALDRSTVVSTHCSAKLSVETQKDGDPLLVVALRLRRQGIAVRLMELGADPFAEGRDGESAIKLAEEPGFDGVIVRIYEILQARGHFPQVSIEKLGRDLEKFYRGQSSQSPFGEDLTKFMGDREAKDYSTKPILLFLRALRWLKRGYTDVKKAKRKQITTEGKALAKDSVAVGNDHSALVFAKKVVFDGQGIWTDKSSRKLQDMISKAEADRSYARLLHLGAGMGALMMEAAERRVRLGLSPPSMALSVAGRGDSHEGLALQQSREKIMRLEQEVVGLKEALEERDVAVIEQEGARIAVEQKNKEAEDVIKDLRAGIVGANDRSAMLQRQMSSFEAMFFEKFSAFERANAEKFAALEAALETEKKANREREKSGASSAHAKKSENESKFASASEVPSDALGEQERKDSAEEARRSPSPSLFR